jgi:Ni,Fe-hydrogenase III small subunit
MTKNEFRDRIKSLVKQVYSGATKSTEIDLDTVSAVSLDTTRFPVLVKFPTLKDTIIKLLTDQYDLFIKDIEWVAPRPTTFRIVLGNDQVFYLIYTDRTWIGKVEGKKYYLLNISEEQNCVESIARILSYGAKTIVEVPTETPAPETPAEEPAAEEPAPEEPVEQPPLA